MQLSCGHDPQWTAFNQAIYNLQDIASERQHTTRSQRTTSKEYYLAMQAGLCCMIMCTDFVYKQICVVRLHECAAMCSEENFDQSIRMIGRKLDRGKSDVGARSSPAFYSEETPLASECTRGNYESRYILQCSEVSIMNKCDDVRLRYL